MLFLSQSSIEIFKRYIYLVILLTNRTQNMNIQELKKNIEHLINQAEELGIENASTLRRQEIFLQY